MVNPHEVQESGRKMGINTKKLFQEDKEAELKKNFQNYIQKRNGYNKGKMPFDYTKDTKESDESEQLDDDYCKPTNPEDDEESSCVEESQVEAVEPCQNMENLSEIMRLRLKDHYFNNFDKMIANLGLL